MRFHEAGLLKLNCDKALAQLQWRPSLDAKETARFTASWYRNFYQNDRASMPEHTRAQITEYVNLARSRGAIWADA